MASYRSSHGADMMPHAFAFRRSKLVFNANKAFLGWLGESFENVDTMK